MNLNELSNVIQSSFLNSAMFPYKSGNLKQNFFDRNGEIISDNMVTIGILSSDRLIKRGLNYGKMLQFAPSIRYRKRGLIQGKPTYIRHKNRHYRYINNIIESSVVPMIENSFGVKRI